MNSFTALTARSLAITTLFACEALSAAEPPVQTYIVQLQDAPAGSYRGGVDGFAATRPVNGINKFDARSVPARNYMAYLDGKRRQVIANGGGIKVERRFSVAYNGFTARLDAAQARKLLATSGVVSVTPVEVRRPNTVSTPDFLGLSKAGGLWSKLDASSRALTGEDVIIGVIDTGIWPEDPAFSDKVMPGTNIPVAYNQPGSVVYGAPPAKWKGVCQTGPGFTADMCNNKLIGARFYENFLHVYDLPLSKASEYFSPRDGDGHGSHTASTAGGNAHRPANINGRSIGTTSGMAPRARIAAYKTCWTAEEPAYSGCRTDNLIAAIDDAVADGVDVINFSISGSESNVPDPVEVAFFNASAAGVFVAVSGGNSGPDPLTVNHRWPWTTTVAASTHDRLFVATVQAGSGANFTGLSYPDNAGLPKAPLVLARNVGVMNFDALNASERMALEQCYAPQDREAIGVSGNAAIDPSKAAGKIVVCLRGGNVLVNKGAAVKAANAAGMVILNTPTSADTTFMVAQGLPAVHLNASAYNSLFSYAAANGAATASFSASIQRRGSEPAPVMASFSSSGPNPILMDILKPDISAPGVSVFASYVAKLTQQQHDQVAAGSLSPPSETNSLDGTSMASPHIAGIAALFKQAYPTWSPAAIKSALMTTTSNILLPNGQIDPDRFRYGAGHVDPNAAFNPGLVYDLKTEDYSRFLCGLGLTPPAGFDPCYQTGSTLLAELNLPSLTASFSKSGTITRTVTNVSGRTAMFVASASLPGWSVQVEPATLTLAPGQSASFRVLLNQTGPDTAAAWAHGHLEWSDGVLRARSPLSIRSIQFKAPAQINDTRASNVRMFTVSAAVRPMPLPRGLVPALSRPGSLRKGDTQCFNVQSYSNSLALRFQLRNDETDGGAATDLALRVSLNGVEVGSSQSPGSDEVVTIMNPVADSTYTACVTNMSTAGSEAAGFKMLSWNIAPGAAPDNMRAYMTTNAFPENAPTTIVTNWSLPRRKGHYLGMVEFRDFNSTYIGGTMVSVEIP